MFMFCCVFFVVVGGGSSRAVSPRSVYGGYMTISGWCVVQG